MNKDIPEIIIKLHEWYIGPKTIILMKEDKITEYVHKNYKSYEGKELIIIEMESHFRVMKHKDSSPLILSKNII